MYHVLLEEWAKEMVTVPMGVSSNTPSHGTWSSGSNKTGWGLIHVEIALSDIGLMFGRVMFVEVINKIFLNKVPINSELFLGNLICNPKLSQLNGSW